MARDLAKVCPFPPPARVHLAHLPNMSRLIRKVKRKGTENLMFQFDVIIHEMDEVQGTNRETRCRALPAAAKSHCASSRIQTLDVVSRAVRLARGLFWC